MLYQTPKVRTKVGSIASLGEEENDPTCVLLSMTKLIRYWLASEILELHLKERKSFKEAFNIGKGLVSIHSLTKIKKK